jgi:arylsulfatase A-like enzyme
MQGRKSEGRPFFCIAGFYNPHSPLVVPREYLDMYPAKDMALPQYPPQLNDQRIKAGFTDEVLRGARQGYYAMISELDHHIGRVLGALEELGLAGNTIVVYTSDHGEFLGEHERWGKGYPGPDCVARTPLIVRDPRMGEVGRVSDAMVEAVDLAPSVLELAGVTVPPHLQGDSWARAVRGEAYAGKEEALMEFNGWKSIRTATHRYLLRADGQELLFDVGKPLGEYHNVAGEKAYAEVLAEHRHQMARRLIQIERPLPRVWPY